MKKTYKINGLDCASCASLVEMDLEDMGLKSKCSYAKQSLEIEGDHDYEKVKSVLEKSGYVLEK